MDKRILRALSLPQDLSHPYTHVVWETQDGHTHLYSAMGGETIEELAEGLSEAVYECGRSRHQVDNKGRDHSIVHLPHESGQAYRSACYQLMTRDYYQEYLDLIRSIVRYELWNGKSSGGRPVPELFLQPKPGTGGRTWQALVTHPDTMLPVAYDIPESLLDIPRPDPNKYVEGELGTYLRGNVNRPLGSLRRLVHG